MDKINLKKRSKSNPSSYMDKKKLQELFLSNKSLMSIKNKRNEEHKDNNELSFNLILEKINKLFESFKFLIKKNFSHKLNQSTLKQINNILNKISDNIKEINSKVNQYQSIIVYNEAKIRNLQGTLFVELLDNEILQNNVNTLAQKEKEYELIKEKAGIFVQNGKIINTNRKDNEIIILRKENSKLKDVIEQYKRKLNQKELEFIKKNNSLMKEKSELILKINNLNHQIQKSQIMNNNNSNINYLRFQIDQKKLDLYNNRKSNRTMINESNDIIDNINMNTNTNIPSTINFLNLYDNNCYINYSISNMDFDKKFNTIEKKNVQTINHSHKNSICSNKIKDKFKNLNDENSNINKKIIKEYGDKNNIINHAGITKNYQQNKKFKLNKKKNLNNNIIIKENYNTKYNTSNKIMASVREKNKSHEHHLSNIVNISNINILKNNKNLNSYCVNHKPFKYINHKKNSSINVNNFPFKKIKHNEFNKESKNNNSNKENEKDNYLLNIKNLILKKEQKNKKNKLYLVHKSIVSNSISSNYYYSINNSRNSKIKNNSSKLHTYNTSKLYSLRLNVNN